MHCTHLLYTRESSYDVAALHTVCKIKRHMWSHKRARVLLRNYLRAYTYRHTLTAGCLCASVSLDTVLTTRTAQASI